MGFEFIIGFIDHIQVVTTGNRSAVANIHALQITRAHAESSESAFTSRFLVMDTDNVLCLRHYWLANVPQWLSSKLCPAYDPRPPSQTEQKNPFLVIVVQLLLVRNQSSSSGCCLPSHYLAVGLHTTVFSAVRTLNLISVNIARRTWGMKVEGGHDFWCVSEVV
jgi:hypothetical protein